MKLKNKKMKAARLMDLKDDLLTSTNRICELFDSLNEKDGLLLLKKINSFVTGSKKSKNSKKGKATDTEKSTTEKGIPSPSPSAKPTNPMDFNQKEFDEYTPRMKHTDSSMSEPFSSSDPESDQELETDDFNNAINVGEEEEYSELDIVKKIRIRDRFGDKDDFLTDKSIVTKHDLNTPRRIDPFKDAGKVLGKYPFQSNQYSNASENFTNCDLAEELSESMKTQLNLADYEMKHKWRMNELKKLGLQKDKLELKLPNSDVCAEREKLGHEYKRYLIDLDRRAQKQPEPNMIDTKTGECSSAWRQWFQNRMDQMEKWLVEDAVNYHLPPSAECDPPIGLKLLTADWNIFRKTETNIPWDFTKYGPMVLRDDMVYDGTKLYNPLNGRTWSNIVEHLEDQVKKRWREAFPGSRKNPFDENGGLFWSQILQQWYDLLDVSLKFTTLATLRSMPRFSTFYLIFMQSTSLDRT